MSKQASKAKYEASAERTPARLYAQAPRPAAVLIQDEQGRFTQVAGSALVYPDRAEIVQLTPEGAAALAQAQGEDLRAEMVAQDLAWQEATGERRTAREWRRLLTLMGAEPAEVRQYLIDIEPE